MTLKKNGNEKFAFLPKVCDKCKRKFIFEGYFIAEDYNMAIPAGVPKYYFCSKCAEKRSIIELRNEMHVKLVNGLLPEYLRRYK